MTEPKDWTPDGPNCRQCGRHDYALQLQFNADGVGSFMAQCETLNCPLGVKSAWSRELPTEPGWYWYRGPGQACECLAQLAGQKDVTLYLADGEQSWHRDNLTGEWQRVAEPRL